MCDANRHGMGCTRVKFERKTAAKIIFEFRTHFNRSSLFWFFYNVSNVGLGFFCSCSFLFRLEAHHNVTEHSCVVLVKFTVNLRFQMRLAIRGRKHFCVIYLPNCLHFFFVQMTRS